MSEDLLKQLVKPSSKFLVYTSAGLHSKCHSWVKGAKHFDLWITSYADEKTGLSELADYYNERKGGKFPNLYHANKTWPEIFKKYDAIFTMDDDLEISAREISFLFRVLFEFDLDILQPAFSQYGKWSHRLTRAKLFSFLRYTNFVEITCPLFRTDKLIEFLSVFDPQLVGWGIDHWYMQTLIGNSKTKAAVVDAVVVVNTFDEFKGDREINKLQERSERIATWKRIQETRGVRDVDPMCEWSTVRKWNDFRFYSGTLTTFLTKLRVRVRVICGIDPSQRVQ
ncbi:MAG: hypothetical protein O3C43_03050 [Verrucomicrobia bacterium]|nr:hypothetical protein [Verrucomicrobiota bacterium]MDA1065461.1 hypothetical protein [Verrucomicrobiota bacterium]